MRPEIVVTHLGWRDEQQREAQYASYARSQGGFYGKYLRQGDLFIALRAAVHLLRAVRRWVMGALRTRGRSRSHRTGLRVGPRPRDCRRVAKRSSRMSLLHAARNAIGWRAAQQAGVQFIYVLRLLILARLLTPEAFGQLAIAMLIVTTLLSLSDVGVIPALVQRQQSDRDEEDAAWTVGLVRAGAIALAVALTAPALAAWFGDPRSTQVIQVLALRPVLASLGSIGVVRLTRAFRFREQAAIQVPGALVDLIVAIALASEFGVWALVIGSLAGAASSSVLSYVFAPHRPRLVFNVGTIRPLIRFGRWVLGTSVVGLIASAGVQFFISRRLGVSELGLYFLATKLAFLPAEAATAVIGSVAFPLYASMQHDDERTKATLRTLLSVFGFVLFPVYVLMIAVAPSFVELLGPQWSGTAQLIRLLGLASCLGFYVDATLPLFMARGRPDRVMVIAGAQSSVLLIALGPLVGLFGANGAAGAWLPAYATAQLISLRFVHRTVGDALSGAGRSLLAIFAASIAASLVALLVQWWLTGIVALLLGVLAAVTTGAFMLKALSRHVDLNLAVLLRAPSPQTVS